MKAFCLCVSMTGRNNMYVLEMDDDEQRLLNYLFTNHNPRLRPVLNKSNVVTVTFGISLHQIIDVVGYSFWIIAINYLMILR